MKIISENVSGSISGPLTTSQVESIAFNAFIMLVDAECETVISALNERNNLTERDILDEIYRQFGA